MRPVTILASVAFLTAALPGHANDNDLSLWSLEDLCDKKDKQRHSEAVFAELERRGVFSASDFELVRSDTIDRGMHESALLCSWGAPDSVTQRDGDAWQTFRNPIDGRKFTVDVHVVAGSVTDIRVRPVGIYPSAGTFRYYSSADLWTTFSGRQITASGVADLPCECTYPNRF